jgi:hypothetical protein
MVMEDKQYQRAKFHTRPALARTFLKLCFPLLFGHYSIDRAAPLHTELERAADGCIVATALATQWPGDKKGSNYV